MRTGSCLLSLLFFHLKIFMQKKESCKIKSKKVEIF